jgi:alanine dehydrogenase
MTMTKSISVIKETRSGEMRVVMMPREVNAFVSAGYDVFVEENAGVHATASNKDYEDAGARIVDTKTAWGASRFVVKYKCPSIEETKFLTADTHIAAYFHAEGSLLLSEAVARSQATAYSYELFQLNDGHFPMPVCDNEIAGKLAVLKGAYHLLSHQGGRGTLLADIPGADRPRVVVIGYGNVGGAAARMVASLGCEVTVFGTNPYWLRRFAASMPAGVTCLLNDPDTLATHVKAADLVIGAILISTYDTPTMIAPALVQQMKPGSVIVDVTCGYGEGYLPTGSDFTSFEKPAYKVHGVQHILIDALPATVPITASQAASHNMLPYLQKMGAAIFDGQPDPVSERGMIIQGGKFVHPLLSDTFNMLKAV